MSDRKRSFMEACADACAGACAEVGEIAKRVARASTVENIKSTLVQELNDIKCDLRRIGTAGSLALSSSTQFLTSIMGAAGGMRRSVPIEEQLRSQGIMCLPIAPSQPYNVSERIPECVGQGEEDIFQSNKETWQTMVEQMDFVGAAAFGDRLFHKPLMVPVTENIDEKDSKGVKILKAYFASLMQAGNVSEATKLAETFHCPKKDISILIVQKFIDTMHKVNQEEAEHAGKQEEAEHAGKQDEDFVTDAAQKEPTLVGKNLEGLDDIIKQVDDAAPVQERRLPTNFH